MNAVGYGPGQQEGDLTLLCKTYMFFTRNKTDSKNANGPGASSDVIDARVPPSAREEFVRGREALAKKSEQDAIGHFQKAILIYPEFFEARLLLATAFMDLREWPKAEATLLRALELKSDNPTTLLALGEFYWPEKRDAEPEKTLPEGVNLNDTN